MSTALATQDLTKRFGAFTAVDRLNLDVREGEIFGLLGSNGAGKSTAIRMLCGLMRPTSGRALVLGVDVGREPERVKKSIGYMTQRFSLYEDLTVRQNLDFFGGVYGLDGDRLRRRREWAVEMAGLEGREDVGTRALAGGWKQRLALACSLLHAPRLVFLDEPTGGVDPVSRRRFWDLIDALASEAITVLVTTHYLDEAEHCHRLALMHAGRLVAQGTVAELKTVFGGRSVLEVTCPRVLEALETLGREGWVLEATVFGARLHVFVEDPDAGAARVRDSLARAGNAPVIVERMLPSLEDVFIHSIGAEERRRAAAGGAS